MTGRETYGEGKEHLMSIKHITLSVMLETRQSAQEAKVVSHLWCYMNTPQQCINTGHSDLSPESQTDVPVL